MANKEKETKNKMGSHNYKLVLPVIIIPLVIISLVIASNIKQLKPEFTFVDFIDEYNESTSYNQIATYTVYNPLTEEKYCYINLTVVSKINSTSETIDLGILEAKNHFSGNFTFLMPFGDSDVDMILECE